MKLIRSLPGLVVSPLTLALALTLAAIGCASPRDEAVTNRDAAGDVSSRGGSDGGLSNGETDTPPVATIDAPVAPDAPTTGDTSATDLKPACELSETRCAGDAVETCDGAGTWTKKLDCPGVCQAGACAGSCRPDTKHCVAGAVPETCNGNGQWIAGNKCPFVCTGAGVCGGQCAPSSKRCGGANMLTPELCDENGMWKANGAACPNICSSGTCGGSCSPAAKQCGANHTPETCSPQGTWEPGTACAFVCTGAGTCGGVCKPGTRDCSGKIPRVCTTNGAWQGESTCAIACVGAGVCTVCDPNIARKCNGGTLQVCKADGSGFRDEKTCASGCNTTRAECNTCFPNRPRCDGSTGYVCNAAGTLDARTDCASACGYTVCSGQCVVVKDNYCIAIENEDDPVKPDDTQCNLHAAQETSFECKKMLTGPCAFFGKSILVYSTTDRLSWTVGLNRYVCAGQLMAQWREIPR